MDEVLRGIYDLGAGLPPEVAMTVCSFPELLHPVSQTLLDDYLHGVLSAPQFLRAFSLPNSDYVPLGQCLVTVLGS
ncbi:MAG: hypothetical protein KDC48_18935 [Planctomycetes bacterium]|nr:hypothetical protein [Planctomycetota bacterium]